MLTASIVIHNSPLSDVSTAVGCLLRSHVDRIYILDNGTEPLDMTALPDSPGIDYRRIPNRGFGAGHNIALREVIESDPEGFHLVMNADICWEGDALTPLVEYMKADEDVGMVQPRILYPDGMLQYTVRRLPSPLDLFMKRFLPHRICRRRMNRYLLADHDHHEQLYAPYFQGSFMLLRNKALIEVGLFDERFFMYPEDIDLSRRIFDHYATLYLPIVEITHRHNAASRHSLRMLWIHLVNMARYFNKWGWHSDIGRRLANEVVDDGITPHAGEPEAGRG